jgi:hypothetical protein
LLHSPTTSVRTGIFGLKCGVVQRELGVGCGTAVVVEGASPHQYQMVHVVAKWRLNFTHYFGSHGDIWIVVWVVQRELGVGGGTAVEGAPPHPSQMVHARPPTHLLSPLPPPPPP